MQKNTNKTISSGLNAMLKPPAISVVICTYNNAESLRITLDQLKSQVAIEQDFFEIIIVDNNSTDSTKQISLDFVDTCKIRSKYYFENKQGLSYARNTGIDNSLGSYILFTDDDANLPETWLSEYYKNIKNYSPDCIYSKIHILWDKPKPWWFISIYTPFFVGLDYGEKLIHVNGFHKEFYGKNFCVKKEILQELGRFDPNLGRKGSQLLAGEETILYRKLIEENKSVIYIPGAPVGHRLKDREYNEDNIRKLYVDGAQSAYYLARLTARKKIFGRPLGAIITNLRIIFTSLFCYIFLHPFNSRSYNYYYKLNILRSATYIMYWLRSR